MIAMCRPVDRLAALCRGVDAALIWHARPKWCRGKLWPAVKRAATRVVD